MLTLRDFALVRMDPGTYMWVDIKTFAITSAATDDELLAALMATPAYRDDYCSPFDPAPMDYPGAPRHAKWWLDRLAPSMFTRVAAEHAVDIVTSWAVDQEWSAGYTGPSDETRYALRDEVFSLFAGGDVFELRPPGGEAFHDYGSVVGCTGYHEFAVIDRESGVLHLIVAADD